MSMVSLFITIVSCLLCLYYVVEVKTLTASAMPCGVHVQDITLYHVVIRVQSVKEPCY